MGNENEFSVISNKDPAQETAPKIKQSKNDPKQDSRNAKSGSQQQKGTDNGGVALSASDVNLAVQGDLVVGQQAPAAPVAVIVQQPQPGQQTQQQEEDVRSYIYVSCCVCLLCNWMFGLAALVMSWMSRSAQKAGDVTKARKCGKAALNTNIVGVAFTVILISIILALS